MRRDTWELELLNTEWSREMPTGQICIYNTCPRTFFSVQAKIYLIEFYKQDFASEVLRFNEFSHIFTFPFVQPPKSIMKHLQKDVKKLPVTYCNAWGKSVRCSLLFVFESGRRYMKCIYSPLQPSDNSYLIHSTFKFQAKLWSQFLTQRVTLEKK